MPLQRYLTPLSSTLFRLAVFLFLRVVPSRQGKAILPALYFSYLASAWFSSPKRDTTTNKTSEKHLIPEATGHDDFLPTVILSLPSSSRRLRITNFAVNTLLLLAAADFLATPFLDSASDVVFSRVGAVYPDSVKIVVRYPQRDVTEDKLRVVWRESKGTAAQQSDKWKDGPVLHFTEERDWVDTVKLGGLWPSTAYEYILLTTNRTISSYPSSPIPFRTFPDPRLPSGNHFRFVVSSCVTQNFPYVPFQGNTIKGFDLLARYLFTDLPHDSPVVDGRSASINSTTTSESSSSAQLPDEILAIPSPGVPSRWADSSEHASAQPPAEFLLFLGDFIYADVPMYIGDDREAYRRLYRRNYQSTSFRKIYERLPVFHTYDDHEIINNFAGRGNDSTPPFPNASDAFRIYNAESNYNSPNNGQHYYYDFRYGDVAFFVMDTRRYRDAGSYDHAATMLGDIQLAALYKWLHKVNTTSTFKFLVTSVPFTSLWGHDAVTDSWAGFTSEKTALLEALHSVPNVIILSGDRHEFAAIEFNSADRHIIREFSTSPLSMFYVPFFRTLRMQSEEIVQRKRTDLNITEEGPQVVTTVEDIPKERVLKYIASGNYKWSAIEVDTKDLENPTLRLEVMVDGKAVYHFEVVGTPVKLYSSTALGAFVSGGIKEMFDRIGIKPSKWF